MEGRASERDTARGGGVRERERYIYAYIKRERLCNRVWMKVPRGHREGVRRGKGGCCDSALCVNASTCVHAFSAWSDRATCALVARKCVRVDAEGRVRI